MKVLKKALGQHFLINPGVVEKISAQVLALTCKHQTTHVIEIGPGEGVLTESILSHGLNVTAVEIDRDLHSGLEEKFSSFGAKFCLVKGDALRSDLSRFSERTYVVAGNLPYNVGSQIVLRFFEDFAPAQAFCFMLQKEVVLRFISEHKSSDYGPLAVKLALSAQVLSHFWVKPGSFRPPPKVDSGVFAFERQLGDQALCDPIRNTPEYLRFSAWLHLLFQHRRKMIRHTLVALKNDPRGQLRAEELSPKMLFDLFRELNEKGESHVEEK